MKPRHLISVLMLCTIGVFLCAPVAQGNTLQVGPGKPFATPCAAIAAAATGDRIEIDSAGSYSGDVCQWSTSGLAIVGVGAGRAVINAAGNSSQGKAIWVISGNDTTVEGIEFTGATVADMNGAGIRQEGKNLTVRNCYFHDNQEGILTDGGNSTILIEFSEFYHNGAGDGFSHNLYIGNVTRFIFRYNYSHGAVVGHLLKSRAAENDIYYNRLTDEATGTASYEIDLPNGGLSFVIGNLIEKGPLAQNSGLVSYQAEGPAIGNPDHELFVINNTMVNDYGRGVFVVVDSSVQVPAVIKNNIFQGSGSVTTQASAVQANNFAGNALLVSAANYDYHLQAGSPAINAGTDPGQGAGASLSPVWQYVHPACAEGRVTSGSVIDIGAYEFNGGTRVPPPNAPARCGNSPPPAPIASFSPTKLAFGNQVLNTSSADQQVTLTNSGTASLSITGISASGDFAQNNTCGSGLAAGASCAITVMFTPTTVGALTGTLSVTDNASGSPQTAILSGTGIAASPGASLAPTTLNFGNQIMGTASPAQIVNLTNGGNATLHISAVTASGDYSQTNTCGSSLGVGANCTISVVFNPTAGGSRTGTLSVADDAPGSPQLAALSGTGVTSAPVVVLSPASVSFGGQVVGTTSAVRSVTLANTGNAALNISSITASGDFAQSNACGSNLGAGLSCTISVTFKPSLGGAKTGLLSIADNAGGTAQTVALTGTGMDFSLSLSSSATTISAGQSVALNVAVTPVGGLNQAVSLACTGAPTMAACTVSPSSVNLNGASPASASISITTSARSLVPTNIRITPPRVLPLMVVALFMLMAMIFGNTLGSRRLAQCFGFTLLAMLFTGGCAGLISKSSPPSPGGTPAGSYAISVTGTTSGRTQSATFTLNVQ